MNFKETFLKLTEYTVPFGYENTLETLLPNGWKKDDIGNYYYEIGNSKTLFTSHLDTACKEREKINHVIEGDIIRTDGTTILGGDNKAGCCILFYLIEKRVHGTYYFFLGEEFSVHNNYPYGSLLAIEDNQDFKKFNRVISFDRKEMGQMIVRQLAQKCCSDEFSDSLISEFSKNVIEYEKDITGYYTDSAFFVNTVSEIVNLSCGVWNEHTKSEYVNIKYTEAVAKAASMIDWESLPVVRKIENKYQVDSRKDSDPTDVSDDAKIFSDIFNILDELYYVCHEFRSYQSFLNHFKPGRTYHFTKWHEDDNIDISVANGKITSNDIIYDSIELFKASIGIEKLDGNELSRLVLSEFIKNRNKLSDARFHYILALKGGAGFSNWESSIDSLKGGLHKMGFKLNQIGKGYEIVKESIIIKSYEKFLSNRNN